MEERRNPNSLWRYFINILPITFSNFPIFWSAEELEWLKGSSNYVNALKKPYKLINDYEAIAKAVPEFREEYSLLEYMETRTLIKSRTFGLRFVKGEES